MNFISLYDGMACGRIAAERAGLPVDNYYASEIDPWAMKVSHHNYPDIVQLGTCENVHYTNLGIDVGPGYGSITKVYGRHIDVLIGGSPCQGFSNAGLGLNFEDPRSALFFQYVRILREIRAENPDVYFMLENVKMKKEWQDIISNLLGVEPIEINSSLVSAQHRKRLYWTNIPGVSQPEYKGLTISDIILDDVPEKYFLSPTAINRLDVINKRAMERGLGYKDCILRGDQKFLNLDANFFKGPDGKRGVIVHHDGRLRMPTPLECERLQTVPEGYTSILSDTQAYKCLGNGWTIDVIAHILSFIPTSK